MGCGNFCDGFFWWWRVLLDWSRYETEIGITRPHFHHLNSMIWVRFDGGLLRVGKARATTDDTMSPTAVPSPASMCLNGDGSRHWVGWSRNSASPPRRPSRSQRSAVSFKRGSPLRKVTLYFGNACRSSAREWRRLVRTEGGRRRREKRRERMMGRSSRSGKQDSATWQSPGPWTLWRGIRD
jgi:hypothetical protein